MPLSVLVVEDRPEIARVLTYLVDSEDRLSLAGVAKDGVEALEQKRATLPRTKSRGVIVMYSSDPDTARAATDLGADAVVDKADDPAGLIELLVGLCGHR